MKHSDFKAEVEMQSKVKKKRLEFKKEDKITRLLWCQRHCCMCGKECGVNIEFAHIVQNGGNNIDNGIPVCYNCHAMIGMYNLNHPRGIPFKIEEIKRRREQIYDMYTSHLVVPVECVITHNSDPNRPDIEKQTIPESRFFVQNLSKEYPVRVRIIFNGYLNRDKIDLGFGVGHYSGDKDWNFNPQDHINCPLPFKNEKLYNFSESDEFQVDIDVVLIDILNRKHGLLRNGYVYKRTLPNWYFEPTPVEDVDLSKQWELNLET